MLVACGSANSMMSYGPVWRWMSLIEAPHLSRRQLHVWRCCVDVTNEATRIFVLVLARMKFPMVRICQPILARRTTFKLF